jgi:hypothetical protein
MSIKITAYKPQRNCLLIALLLLVSGQSIAKTDTSNHANKLAIYIPPTAWLDPWDGSSTRTGLEYSLSKKIAICFEGGVYFPDQPAWIEPIKSDVNGYIIRLMAKQYIQHKRFYTTRKKYKWAHVNCYVAAEVMFKHQTFNLNDSILINNAPPFNKVYTINRYAAGVNVMYGEAITYKWGLIVDYYGGVGFRFKHSTSSLPPALENGILTGENHGDLIGDAERAIGNNYLPVLFAGIKIGYRLL